MEHLIPPAPPLCPIFFTVSLRRPGADLLILEVERLRQAVRVTRVEWPFQIHAWVVLPDHLHAIWTLPDADYAARWRLIKARFAKGRPVWQPRFWAQPLTTAADYDRHMRACQMDPVRHGLVDEPGAWPFSSFQTTSALALTG
jgi:putative transposase